MSEGWVAVKIRVCAGSQVDPWILPQVVSWLLLPWLATVRICPLELGEGPLEAGLLPTRNGQKSSMPRSPTGPCLASKALEFAFLCWNWYLVAFEVWVRAYTAFGSRESDLCVCLTLLQVSQICGRPFGKHSQGGLALLSVGPSQVYWSLCSWSLWNDLTVCLKDIYVN